MTITPDTNIRLLKCPLQLDNKNQITFQDKVRDQYPYFLSLPYTEVSASYYQRANSSIFYPGHYDDMIHYNYCMYQNHNYTDKWYFAYITGMKYISDNCTQIFLAEDVFQTWYYDAWLRPSFVEREMLSVSDDVPRS